MQKKKSKKEEKTTLEEKMYFFLTEKHISGPKLPLGFYHATQKENEDI